MERYLFSKVSDDLKDRIVLVSGPRQVGKTYLAKEIAATQVPSAYLNYDLSEHRKILRDKSWDRENQLLVLDELHKMKSWKRWLKGVYDTDGIPPRYLVTGSARMDAFGKSGDSLAGRHFLYRLHPFSLKEVGAGGLETMLVVGSFPEPFLRGTKHLLLGGANPTLIEFCGRTY